jgi:hypothetical protein
MTADKITATCRQVWHPVVMAKEWGFPDGGSGASPRHDLRGEARASQRAAQALTSYFETTSTFSQGIPCVAANTLATVSATA